MITVRTYCDADRSSLVQLMTELQGHVASIDPLHRIRKLEDFDGEAYVNQLLNTCHRENGSIFIAEEDGIILGFIAGGIPEETEDDLLDHYPAREGKIHELVVSEKYRQKGIGSLLMEKMEEQLRDQNCEYIRVGVFAPNTGTNRFYEKCGYADRYTEMIKKIAID